MLHLYKPYLHHIVAKVIPLKRESLVLKGISIICIEVQGTSKLPPFSRGTLRITAMAGESGLRESETSSCAWSGQPNGQDVEVCPVSKVEGL